MKRISRLVFLIFITIVLLALIFYKPDKDVYHGKVVALCQELNNRPTTNEDLRHLLGEPRFRGLTLNDDVSNEWIVETPLELGARNWILYIEVHDSKVVGYRVRTADTQGDHPKGAPADKSLP